MSTPLTAPDIARREPKVATTYSGDQLRYFGQVMSKRKPVWAPLTGNGLPLWPVAVTYSPEIETTTVGFSEVPPPGGIQVLGDWPQIHRLMRRRRPQGVAR